MRKAVSADTKKGLDSVVNPQFRRRTHFILIDQVGRNVSEVRTVDNPFYGQHQPG